MATKQLTRSETDKKLAGVCGGLAEYFNIDPTIVRVAAVVLALMGPGLIAYVILWIAVPKASSVGTARIAEERYARGEITADELARIRADLTGS